MTPAFGDRYKKETLRTFLDIAPENPFPFVITGTQWTQLKITRDVTNANSTLFFPCSWKQRKTRAWISRRSCTRCGTRTVSYSRVWATSTRRIPTTCTSTYILSTMGVLTTSGAWGLTSWGLARLTSCTRCPRLTRFSSPSTAKRQTSSLKLQCEAMQAQLWIKRNSRGANSLAAAKKQRTKATVWCALISEDRNKERLVLLDVFANSSYLPLRQG